MHKTRISLSKKLLAITLILALPNVALSQGTKNIDRSASALGETVCLGRLLVSLPMSAEFAEGGITFESAYGFNGIKNVQAQGDVTWGGAMFNETAPTDLSALRDVLSQAKAKLRSSNLYKGEIADARQDVDRWRDKVKHAGSGDESELFKKILREKEDVYRDLLFGAKVSGVATSVAKNEFAVRPFGVGYAVGFWDAKDRRIRTFKGDLKNQTPESPEAAALELRRWREVYRSRTPEEIPAGAGFCSSFGFFDETKGADQQARMKIPFRMKQYPNLLFYLSTEPTSVSAPVSILDLPDLAIGQAELDTIGVKVRHEPDKVQILGTPGRVYAQEYGPNCASKNDCRPPDQAYEIHAETFGEAGHLERPHLVLYMVAATSDEYKVQRKAIVGNPSYNTPERPALKGTVPPSYKVGREIFDQVLQSIRVRPGAISTTLDLTRRKPSGKAD